MNQLESVSAEQTVEDAFCHILLNNQNTVHEWEPVAVAGKDIAGVHRMRVGLRRMRSALTVFRPVMPKKVTAPLAQEMRWAGKALEHARDLDVYISDNLYSEGGEEHKEMRKIALRHRKSVYGEVRRFIEGERYERLNSELSRWMDRRAWREQLSKKHRKGLDAKVTPFAAQVMEQHRTRIIEDAKINELDDDALHQLRIDCKKLRYATEFFSPLYGKSMEQFSGQLKGLQDVLGALHDIVIMKELQKSLLEGENSGKAAESARKLEDNKAKQVTTLRQDLEHRWDDFAQTRPPWKDAAASN